MVINAAKRMSGLRGLGVVLGLSYAFIAQAAMEQPGDFDSLIPLQLSGEGPWYRLQLPLRQQFAAAPDPLADVRVFNGAGQSLAYALVHETPPPDDALTLTAVRGFPLYAADNTGLAAPAMRVRRAADGRLLEVQPEHPLEAGEEVLRGWLIDASAIHLPLVQLVLDWAAEREGFQRFSIEASDDLQQWRPWGTGQVARLSFADERIEQRRVHLPGQPARYLRLLWRAPQGAPVLTTVQLLSSPAAAVPPPLIWSQPLAGRVEGDGVYTWPLPSSLAVERLQLEIFQPNSLAPVEVYGRDGAAEPWRALQSGLLYRLAQTPQDLLHDELDLPGERVRELRLQVDERGGGLGAQAPALRIAVRPVQLVFLARGAGPFNFASGNDHAEDAQLPLALLVPDGRPLALLDQAIVAGPALSASVPSEAAVPGGSVGRWASVAGGLALLCAVWLSLLAWNVRRKNAR